jgi:hypothetical protein
MSGDFIGEKGFDENLERKSVFWALGEYGPRAFEVNLYLRFLAKFFEKNLFRVDSPRLHGGQSEINLETYRMVRSSGGSGGRSVTFPRTVCAALADSSRGPSR